MRWAMYIPVQTYLNNGVVDKSRVLGVVGSRLNRTVHQSYDLRNATYYFYDFPHVDTEK